MNDSNNISIHKMLKPSYTTKHDIKPKKDIKEKKDDFEKYDYLRKALQSYHTK